MEVYPQGLQTAPHQLTLSLVGCWISVHRYTRTFTPISFLYICVYVYAFSKTTHILIPIKKPLRTVEQPMVPEGCSTSETAPSSEESSRKHEDTFPPRGRPDKGITRARAVCVSQYAHLLTNRHIHICIYT